MIFMAIFKEYIYSLFFSIVRNDVKITPFSRLDRVSVLEGNNRIGRNTILLNCRVGKYTYMGNSCTFSNTSIGRFCSIASNVQLINGTHPTKRFASTHPAFYAKKTPVGNGFVGNDKFEEFRYTSNGRSLEIGNDVWIGSQVILLGGIKIGDGSIIAAGSVVTKDVPPYTIVGGVPARVIRKRFEEREIQLLQKIRWWEWPTNKIHSEAFLFDDVTKLLKKYEESVFFDNYHNIQQRKDC